MVAVRDRWRKKDGTPSAEAGKGMQWTVTWVQDGKQAHRNFPYKRGNDPTIHADAFALQLGDSMNKGTAVDLDMARRTVSQYAEEWRLSLGHADSTELRTERTLRRQILPAIGHIRMCDVRASHMRTWMREQEQTMAPSSLSRAWRVMQHLFHTAVVDRVIGFSPCEGVKLPEIDTPVYVVPTDEQVATLVGEIADEYSAAIMLAAGTGMRFNEIMGLELDDIDFLRKKVYISQQLVFLKAGQAYIGRLKSKRSVRDLDLPDAVLEALAEHVRKYPPVTFTLEDRTSKDRRKWQSREVTLLFPYRSAGRMGAQPMRYATWSNIWRKAATKAGIEKGTGIHCLRHFCATVMIAEGCTLTRVQQQLGHASPETTMRVYIGYWPDTDNTVSGVMDKHLRRRAA